MPMLLERLDRQKSIPLRVKKLFPLGILKFILPAFI